MVGKCPNILVSHFTRIYVHVHTFTIKHGQIRANIYGTKKFVSALFITVLPITNHNRTMEQ